MNPLTHRTTVTHILLLLTKHIETATRDHQFVTWDTKKHRQISNFSSLLAYCGRKNITLLTEEI